MNWNGYEDRVCLNEMNLLRNMFIRKWYSGRLHLLEKEISEMVKCAEVLEYQAALIVELNLLFQFKVEVLASHCTDPFLFITFYVAYIY